MNNDLQEYTIAIHEAGHVVMAALLGKTINYVTIVPEDGVPGKFEHINDIPYGAKSDEVIGLMMRDEVLILVAGTTAEAVILNINPINSRGKNDYDKVDEILEAPNDGLAKERADYIHEHAYKMFRNSIIQYQIKAVANALIKHKTLTGSQVSEILKEIKVG